MGSISSFDNQSYDLKEKDTGSIFDNEVKVKNAEDWKNVNNKIIITPTDTLEELEKQWRDFNSMIKKHRRESDWKSIEIFGMANQDTYDKLKSKFIASNFDNYTNHNSIEEYIQSSDDPTVESFTFSDTDMTDIMNTYYSSDDSSINYNEDAINKAIEWGKEFNRVIITPTRTLNELETLWEAYHHMLIKHRRESDWKSIELFGVNNQNHYEILKSNFLKEDISEEEKSLYDNLVRESASVEITDSPRMILNYLAEEAKTAPKIEIMKSLLELYAQNNSAYDEVLTLNGISDVLDNCPEVVTSIPEGDLIHGDLPYVSPEEMIDMGVYGQAAADNYYGEEADNTELKEGVSTRDWFKSYKAASNGFYYEEFTSISADWVSKVRELTYGLNEIKKYGTDNEINARKQSILELGWDPEIPFNDKSRVVAKELFREHAMQKSFSTEFIDLREFNISISKNQKDSKDDENKEQQNEKKPVLKPVFIVLTEGKALISKIIKKATNNIYSHSSISFDPSLKTMYSFLTGGIQTENIENVKDGRRIGVYSFFVEEDKYNNIKRNIKYYMDNKDKTHYSVLNLITYLLHIKMNMDWNMICSQFVDKMLKLAEIDLSKKDSSQVSPADFSEILKKNRKVYTLYKGLGEKYDDNKITKILDELIKRAKPITEGVFFENEYDYIRDVIANIHDVNHLMQIKEYSNIVSNEKIRNALNKYVFVEIQPCCESKVFPVQFASDGNLLIANISKLNYELEYMKSNKLLREYLNSANIEGIKYELAKLWMINTNIENKIYTKKIVNSELFNSYTKIRVKILNDFRYYLNEVIKIEPTFDFTNYYDSTPFSSAVIKINNTTMSGFSNLVKTFINPLH